MAIASPLQPSNGNSTKTLAPSCLKAVPIGSENLHSDLKQPQRGLPEPEPLNAPPQAAIPAPNPDFVAKYKNSNDSKKTSEAKNFLKKEDRNEPEISPYLLNLTEKDAETLRIPDDRFVLDSWETVKKRVRENKLDEFKRVPSQLRKYLEYVWGLKQSPVYGGVQNFILRERLGWDLQGRPPPLPRDSQDQGQGSKGAANGFAKGEGVNGKTSSDLASQPPSPSTTKLEDEETPTAPVLDRQDTRDQDKDCDNKSGDLFANPQDIKILQNDWPYGIDERIVHLVVWTKFPLEDDPITRNLKADVRSQIDDFVKRTFTSSISSPTPNPKASREDSVIWFKNWTSIKSIHAIEHFHVMLFDPDPEFVDQVTGGDVPLWKKKRRT